MRQHPDSTISARRRAALAVASLLAGDIDFAAAQSEFAAMAAQLAAIQKLRKSR